MPVVQPAGAAWYSGAGFRYTVSSPKPNNPPSIAVRNDGAPSGAGGSGGTMPFGLPVVPDE